MAEPKGLAITALALGLLGLFTGGLLGVGSLLGLVLAIVALVNGPPHARREVAWAAIAANTLALLTLLPLGLGYLAYRESPLASYGDDSSLPEPVQQPLGGEEQPVVPPPPPPPAPERASTAGSSGGSRGVPSVDALHVGGAIREPRKTRNVAPVYPQAAREARVQGTVVLECTISPKGKVVNVKVLRGVPLLAEAAIEAVKQWEYTPTLLSGVPVPVIMTVTVNFRLS